MTAEVTREEMVAAVRRRVENWDKFATDPLAPPDGGRVWRAVLRELEAGGWRPIESAPENESVLIFIPNAEHYGHGVYRGMLVNMGTGRRWCANAVAMGRDLGRDTMPTHWMPLPSAPLGTSEGQDK